MSELILQKKAKKLCLGEGNAWSLNDFEKGVPGVTMLTVVADDKKRREYLDRAKLMLRRTSRRERRKTAASHSTGVSSCYYAIERDGHTRNAMSS
jgi:hypothetical protein